MVVVVRRLVRRCREVVRSIALVVHHIQATHSDGTERSVRQRQSEERSAHNTATPETSDGLYPLSHRCLHICPNAYNGHVVQFAYRQCASRCALDQHHPGPRNGSKRYVTHCILKMEKKKKKKKQKNSSLTSFQTASDWVRISFPSSHSFFFGGELYLDRAGAIYSRPPGKGLHGAVEFSKALTPAVSVRFWSHWWHSFIKV